MKTKWDLYDWTVRRPLLLAGVLVALAVITVLRLPLWCVLVLTVLLLLLLLLPSMRRIVPFFCLLFLLLGLWRGVLYRYNAVEPLTQFVGSSDTIEGVVEECPRSGHMYTVRVTRATSLPPDTRLLLYCSDQVAPSLYDTVATTVELKALYNTQLYRRADNVYLQAFPTTYNEDCVMSRAEGGLSFISALRPFRLAMTDAIIGLLGEDTGGLLAAVCLGERSYVDATISEAFRASGLSHLLSVSGLHMSVIAGGMLMLMRSLRIKRIYGHLLTITVILLFVWIVEFTPSVTRAGIMYLVLIVGQMTRHQADSLNSLGLALSLIILVSPSAIYDIGLWLSFAATFGILCMTPRIRAVLDRPLENLPPFCQKPLRFITKSVAISIGCTLPVAPILLLVFGEISLISPLTNILAIMPSSWMTVLGCMGALLSVIPYIGFLGKGLLVVAGVLAEWIILVSEQCAGIAGAILKPIDPWMIWLLSGGGLLLSVAIICLSFRRVCYVLCALLSTCIIILPIHAAMTENATTVAVAADKYGTVVVLQRRSQAVVLANHTASLHTVAGILDDMRVTQPQLLVVNKCLTQHEAYLADWKRDYSSLTVASAQTMGTDNLSDYSIDVGTVMTFWNNCTLEMIKPDWWALSIADTQMQIGLSRWASVPKDMPATDAVLLHQNAVTGEYVLKTDVVFFFANNEGNTDAQNVQYVSTDTPRYLVTEGDGVWYARWW